jgi:hypothetical protein
MLSLLHSGLSRTRPTLLHANPLESVRQECTLHAHARYHAILYDLLVRKSTSLLTFLFARSRNKRFSVSFSLFPTLSFSILPLLPSFTPLFFSLFSFLFPLSHTMASLLILLVYITSTSFSPSFPNTGFWAPLFRYRTGSGISIIFSFRYQTEQMPANATRIIFC